MNGRVCWSWASITSSGSAAKDCGSGQRRRNPAAPSAKHRFPRPRAASQPAYWPGAARPGPAAGRAQPWRRWRARASSKAARTCAGARWI